MNESGKRFIDNVNDHPLPAPLFMDLMNVALDAMRGKRREIPPAAERIMQPDTFYLTDCPENQMGMSIVSECHKRFADTKQAADTSQSFLFRWFAVQIARDDGRLAEFTKKGDEPGVEMINSAVFEAAASCPLNNDGQGGFDDSYAERVRTLMAEENDE